MVVRNLSGSVRRTHTELLVSGGLDVRWNVQAYDISALNILVLEKHLLIRKLLTDVFREFGVPTVQSTPDPETAWGFFTQFPADIVLCDWCEELDGMGHL
ncbi:MAG: response regulator [Gammaproteobacteria bacterium]|nr:response regulator [Gammaproteobacteria bacterium]